MSYTTTPGSGTDPQETKPNPVGPSKSPKHSNTNRKIILGLLIVALLCTWAYIILDKQKNTEVIHQKEIQIVTASTAKDSLQTLFNTASARVDSLTSSNVNLQGAMAEQNSAILKLKANISKILANKNATKEELEQAKDMITELNAKVSTLNDEISRLKGENSHLTAANQQLTQDKAQLSQEKQGLQDNLNASQVQNKDLSDKVDIASTLHASNIMVSAIHIGHNGKESETSKSKRASQFVITCQLDENRVTPSGRKLLYVVVHNPDGTISGEEGNFTTRDGAYRPYTSHEEVNYEQGKSQQVKFIWKPNGKFQNGNYVIEIYNNGFKIGEGRKTLKKSGFLGL